MVGRRAAFAGTIPPAGGFGRTLVDSAAAEGIAKIFARAEQRMLDPQS